MSFKYLVNRSGLYLKKYSPEILTVVGTVSFVATVITACRQTTKASYILDKHRENMDEIKEAELLAKDNNLIDEMGNNIPYDKKEVMADKAGVTLRTGVEFAKLYSVPIVLGAASLTSFLSANRILKARYSAALLTLNALSEAFDRYRARVREEGGIDLDRHYMYGSQIEKKTIVEMDEDGKEVKKKEEVELSTSAEPLGNPYARFFDESCPDWDKNPEFNKMFLQGQEAIANNMLKSRGHLFLNEVYDMLGIERSSVGALVGWLDDGCGDGYVDFGLYRQDSRAVRRFVNGVENVILLDFNVDGVIYDKLGYKGKGSSRFQDVIYETF